MEIFAFIKLALIIIILVASFSSYLVYHGRRRDSVRTLSAIRNELSPERRLTPQERETLSPLLFDPHKHEKALHLEDEGVYVLEGQFARHGLDTNGATTWHDTIAGVEVVLPFDAEIFLEQENRAEVVFAGQYAIVLRLNNAFELQEGLERDKQRQQENAAWEAGVRGTLHDSVSPQKLATDDPALAPAQESTANHVTILSQREETPAEIESREGRGIGLLSALSWVLGFSALAIATIHDLQSSRYIWMAVAALFIGLGLWQFWRRWRLPSPQKVNRVVGPFNLHALMTEAPSDKVTVQPMLGDKLAFTVPEPWLFALDMQPGTRIEAELRVEDCSAVRFGKQLSIEEEVRHFPLVWWGRHFTLALVGSVALLFALYASPGVRADLALALHWLTNTSPVLYTDPHSLAAELPAEGDLIILQGEGRCQVQPLQWERSSISCQHLRWGGDMPVAQNTQLEPAIVTLSSGDFIQTRRDLRLEMQMALHGGGRGVNQPLVVTNIEEVVALVDAVCNQLNGEDTMNTYGSSRQRDIPYRCQQMRNGLLENVHLPVDTEPGNWETMLSILAEPYAGGDAWEAVTLATHVTQLHQRGKSLAGTKIAQQEEILASEIMVSQRGGVLLEIIDSNPTHGAPNWATRNQQRLWPQLVALTMPDKGEPFQISGLVLEQTLDHTGAPTLLIDIGRQLDQPWPATLRALWLVLAMMLVLIHGPLCLRNYLAKRARTQAIQQRYQKANK